MIGIDEAPAPDAFSRSAGQVRDHADGLLRRYPKDLAFTRRVTSGSFSAE